jgi:FKBP-type peptidyl-prolyl cis-trans isomerase
MKRLLAFTVLALLVGCGYPDPRHEATAEAPTMNLAALTQMASGLSVQDLEIGDGEEATRGRRVVVHYTGWFLDGEKFDSSVDRGETYSIPLGEGRVIAGWDEGIAGMKVGGWRRLVIPPELGYGERGSPPVIPPSSTLVFDVELLDVK